MADVMQSTPGFSAVESSALGTPVELYKPRGFGNFLTLFFGFIMTVGGGVLVLYTLNSAQIKSDEHIPLVIVGVFLLIFGWALIESWLRKRGL